MINKRITALVTIALLIFFFSYSISLAELSINDTYFHIGVIDSVNWGRTDSQNKMMLGASIRNNDRKDARINIQEITFLDQNGHKITFPASWRIDIVPDIIPAGEYGFIVYEDNVPKDLDLSVLDASETYVSFAYSSDTSVKQNTIKYVPDDWYTISFDTKKAVRGGYPITIEIHNPTDSDLVIDQVIVELLCNEEDGLTYVTSEKKGYKINKNDTSRLRVYVQKGIMDYLKEISEPNYANVTLVMQ